MSVIGIDFGNESCYIAVARAGGIETIANDYSLRATPSFVAFGPKNRILGVAAKNQMVTNMKNTVHCFKRLLGREFNDPYIQNELKPLAFRVGASKAGGVGITVHYLDEDRVFSPEQMTAMLFTKLKEIAETSLKMVIHDCVISVPSYFTDVERKALLDAASIAGLNVLRLFNETTATALAYGIYKQDLPAHEEKPRNVIFVDCGHTSLQVSACAFHKGKLKMLASTWDAELGGRDFDHILATHFAEDFLTRYRIDARNNPRAWVRLMTEVEKIKKQMSANSTKLPLNIECFMDDKDVHGDIKRTDMEKMCEHLFERVEKTLQQCLDDCKLRLEEIYAVEIVGGSSRIPAIKQLIEQIFHKTASTTLNQDEAVARGCALQCAMLSPAIRVREFSVTDVVNYPIKLTWETFASEFGEMEVFVKNHALPFTKILTFYRKEPFTLHASYSGDIQRPRLEFGKFTIKGIKPDTNAESQKVKVKVRMNLHGILSVTSATLMEKLKPGEQEPPTEIESMDAEDEVDPEPPVDKKVKKKKQIKVIELPIDSQSCSYSQQELNNLVEEEWKMIHADRQEKERVDVRNALEEYVYDLRGKLMREDQLATFVPEAERAALWQELDGTEAWLYEEGEDCAKTVYSDRLAKLKGDCEPIRLRRAEYEVRDAVLLDLSSLVMLSRKFLDYHRSGDERYTHVTAQEADKVRHAIDNTHKWLEEARITLAGTSRTQNPPILCSKIREEKQALEAVVYPVLNKPKVDVPNPPKEDDPKENTEPEPTEESMMDVE